MHTWGTSWVVLDKFLRQDCRKIWRRWRQQTLDGMYMISSKQRSLILYISLKSLDPIHRRTLWTRQNNRFDLYMYTNKKYSSFYQPYTLQTYKEIQNKKPVNSKPKLLSNTMFRISLFQTTDVHRRTERISQ